MYVYTSECLYANACLFLCVLTISISIIFALDIVVIVIVYGDDDNDAAANDDDNDDDEVDDKDEETWCHVCCY